jgi:hypothetical protein
VEEEVRVAPEQEVEVQEGEIELFHATSQDFTDFNVMGMTDGTVESPRNELGIHLGTKEQSQNRAKTKNIPENKQRLIKVKINPKNVVRVDDVGRWTLSKYRNILQNLGLVSEERGVAKEEIKSFDDVLRVLKENNIDAFVYENKYEGIGDSYIVFDNESLTQTDVEIETKIKDDAKPTIKTPPGSRLFNKPLEDATTIANRISERTGIDYEEAKRITKLDVPRAIKIAQAFEALESDPNNPEVQEAYQALIDETIEQYNAIIESGYTLEVNNEEPYDSSQDMIDDLRNNKNLKIFSTESGFGEGGI